MKEHIPAMIIRGDKKRYKNLIKLLKNNNFNLKDKENLITEITVNYSCEVRYGMHILIGYGEEIIHRGEQCYTVNKEILFTPKLHHHTYEAIQRELEWQEGDNIDIY